MEIKIPEVGESVREALLARWFKKSGDVVKRDEPICEIETDKITLDLNADADGELSISVAEGTTVPIGTTIGTIMEGAQAQKGSVEENLAPPPSKSAVQPASSPSLRREMLAQNISAADVVGSGKGGRITSEDLQRHVAKSSLQPDSGKSVIEHEALATTDIFKTTSPQHHPVAVEPQKSLTERPEVSVPHTTGREDRRPMSPLRKRVAARLVSARQQTAMLTTFNEADLFHVKALRSKYREHFIKRHGAPLGLMPFFVRASIEALKEFPLVNASIDGDDIVLHHYYDIGVAIGGDKGLVVPVLRDAEKLKMFEIDLAIASFAEKIKSNRLAISDLEGGTFTVSNGGVYGSMLSTPILNPPQSAVLGMHSIQERPVVRDGQIVIRPMMYLALSYDHRIIDGREAVNFLKKIKEYVEEPEALLLES